MPFEVGCTDEFESWWDALFARAQDDVSRIVNMLTEQGPQLPYPHCSAVKQSRHSHMRELRVQSGGRPIRVFYAFDPRRMAILLTAALKTQGSRFYDYYVPHADMVYDRYLSELRREGLIRSYEPYTVTHRPWSEMTKHWSPERKAANARAEAKIRDDIRRLQAQARKEGRAPGDAPTARSSSRRAHSPIRPIESGLEPARDLDRDSGPSR